MALDDGAQNIIFNSLGVKKGEKVLVLVDVDKKRIGESLFHASCSAGAETIMVKILPSTRHGEEPPTPVARLMREFDVVVIATKYSMSHTKARVRANRAGARIVTMPGVTEYIMSEGGIIADFDEIDRCIKRIYKFIKGKKRVRISTDLGTNLELDLTGRRWITDDTGICKDKGDFMTLPAGEIFIAPQELTTSGTLIIDGSFGEVVDEPITVTIRKGYATEFTGGGNVVLELDKRGKEGRNIAEFGIGLNPIAKIIGHKIEDEKVLGTVHIGFGDNSTFGGKVECGVHLDAVIRNPTVTIEDALILERGVLKI